MSEAPNGDSDSIVMMKLTEKGQVTQPRWLARAEGVHRQLRPQIVADYPKYMREVIADGADMCVAARGEAVLAVAIYRFLHNTANGPFCYVDDLVTEDEERSAGVGGALLSWIEAEARRRGCNAVGLDSGVQRGRAHKFYFREGFVVTSFNFKKSLV